MTRQHSKDSVASSPPAASPPPPCSTVVVTSPDDESKQYTNATRRLRNKRPSSPSEPSANPPSLSARDRKRALDRKAQRASREKTRARIAHLENLVKVLSEEHSEAETVRDLLGEIDKLHAESERLKKVIKEIRGVVDEYGGSEGHGRRSSISSNHDNGEVSVKRRGVTSLSEEVNGFPRAEGDYASGDFANRSRAEEKDTVMFDPRAAFRIEHMSSEQWAKYILDDGIAVSSSKRPPKQNRPPQMIANPLTRKGQDTSAISFSWKCPVPRPSNCSIPMMLPPPPPCRNASSYWNHANRIYARVFNESPSARALAADQASPGSIVKFVKDGWDALDETEKSNPLLSIMKEVDEHLFWDMDPIIKIANYYKSHVLLKYYFNNIDRHLEKVPEWQRPIYSQNTKPHPILIDFFPWPELRDYLIDYYPYYSPSSEISEAYRKHLRFRWPFAISEAYTFDLKTKQYSLTPLFEEYFRNPRNWGMQKTFFEQFPSMRGKMRAYEWEEAERVYVGGVMISKEGNSKSEKSAIDLDGMDVDTAFENVSAIEELYFGYQAML
ncbi:hypothetical protein F5884DRAFT_859174 [Xylogone sp. PMI_703]|nr:hypothetical protein F5884DRAFT_859174 [Xylogone sp. PMI_703]